MPHFTVGPITANTTYVQPVICHEQTTAAQKSATVTLTTTPITVTLASPVQATVGCNLTF